MGRWPFLLCPPGHDPTGGKYLPPSPALHLAPSVGPTIKLLSGLSSAIAVLAFGFFAEAQSTKSFIEKFNGTSPVVFTGTLAKITDQRISDDRPPVLHKFCDVTKVIGQINISEDTCVSLYRQPFRPNVTYNGQSSDRLDVGARYLVSARLDREGNLLSYSVLGGHLTLTGEKGTAFISSAKGNLSRNLWVGERSLYFSDQPQKPDDVPAREDVLSVLIIAYSTAPDEAAAPVHIDGLLYIYPNDHCPHEELVFNFNHKGRLFDVKIPGPFDYGRLYTLRPHENRCYSHGRTKSPSIFTIKDDSIEDISFEELTVQRQDEGKGWLFSIKGLNGEEGPLHLKLTTTMGCVASDEECAEYLR